MTIEAADVGDPVLDGPAAFQDQGPIAVLRQQIAGEEPGRAGADDDRPVRERARAGLRPVEIAREHRSRVLACRSCAIVLGLPRAGRRRRHS